MERRKKEHELERQIKEREEEKDKVEEKDGKTREDHRPNANRGRKRRWDIKATNDSTLSSKDTTNSDNNRQLKKKSRWQVQDEVDEATIKTRAKREYLKDIPIIDGIPLTEANLDLLLPSSFKKLEVPSTYEPKFSKPADKSEIKVQTDIDAYVMPESNSLANTNLKYGNPQAIHEVPGLRDLQFFKESDLKVFGKLIETKNIKTSDLSPEDAKERRCMKLILRVKNGAPSTRKVALRTLTDNARSFGPSMIFNIILPLMLDKTLEDQERHLLVKVIGRVLFKLNDSVRPYTSKILVVIMPLLIDENLYTRLEGQEIISNLAKASGLSSMISTLRPDIDHSDDYVRNLVARTLAVTTSSLGIQSMLPFLKAVCNSQKSELARHTGVKTIQQIAIIMGSSILPHLNGLVNCIARRVKDESLHVRTLTANCIGSLAIASAPYGYESFESIVEPLWQGLTKHRGKALASFIRAFGNLIPLMDEEYGAYYTKEVFQILKREFN
ncbi:unnamed protein product [Ambrosiozyma monospora]|uniref:Unnamed protein product n=1 Tax=Ambrosiozyma monospora TaxID=43982 RepID=A0ACB5TAP4_AMBMO|nr:unnamed protein product [Ambrosiozyma monospora]